MRFPLSWLRDYVEFEVDAATLAHDLTMSGTKIEAIEESGPDFEGVFVGKVVEHGRHPNADKLSLCRVEVGGEVLPIVCGAPNVRAGLTVAVAKVGARLPNNFKIRKSKIRGEVSQGMICSARELGLGSDADGILELDGALASGTDYCEIVGQREIFFDAEITPNRPDCLALLGIAREVAALYGLEIRRPGTWQGKPDKPSPIRIEIENAEDCGRYIGRVIRNVRIAESPEWLQARLRAMDLEPINNVVDITNFVLFESGQPLHAFDLDRLRGGRIVVRRARQGEILRTLDHVERKLDPSILVIADAERAVALAGIIGGEESAVQDETRDLLLESAFFRPDLVRSGRRKLALDTDASYRFERGADPEAARWAADRATHLLLEIAGGEVVEAEADADPRERTPIVVSLRVDRANRLIGTHLDAMEIAAHLKRIELGAEPQGDRVEVVVPSFRRDLTAEIDLIEEVARLHGYDNIPDDLVPPAPLMPSENRYEDLLTRLRKLVTGLGYFEIRTSAFMDREDPDRMKLDEDDVRRKFVCVRNPLVRFLDTMRTSLIPGAIRVLQHNRNHGYQSVRLLQLDRIFLDVPGPNPGLPTEAESLLMLVCGDAQPETWEHLRTARKGVEVLSGGRRPYDLYDLKGELEAVFNDLRVDTEWAYGYTQPFLDAKTSFRVSGSSGAIGSGGAVSDEVLRAFDVDTPVFLFELQVADLAKHLPDQRLFAELPRFPAVKRDLSLVVPQDVPYKKVHAAVVATGGPSLESVQCFDVFEGQSEGSKARSLGLRLRFRSPERTLSDAAVEPWIEAILRELRTSLRVELRAG